MPYLVVQDFKAGLNRNRLPVTSTPGSLLTLQDAHVNRGGEVEKRKAWVPWRDVPNTLGMAIVAGVTYVFGPDPDVPVPSPVVYQQLPLGGGVIVTEIRDVAAFAGKLYVAARCSDNLVRHWYDGVQVTEFTGQADAERGDILLAHNANMYAASGSILHRSGLDAPTDWATATTGAGFFDMATQAAGSEDLTGLAEYQSGVAVFSRRTTQLWSFDPDPDASAKQQTLRNTGCVAPNTVAPFAGSDVFFLSDTGVRSLRARDLTDSPVASDVGTAIDEAVVEWVRTASAADLRRAHGVIEPTDGRYWLVLGDQAYVFSYFLGARISAWSTYTLPAAPSLTVAGDRSTFVRIGDTIYLYGGESGAEYDATPAIVETPFLDARSIASWKRWTGIDIAAEGSWDVYMCLTPSSPTTEDLVGRLENSTFHQLDIAALGAAPAIKLRFVSRNTGPAKLGAIAAHYERDRSAT